MSLFKELKRRNVIRIAGIYAVVAWILMQVAGTLEASLRLPEWFDSVVTAGLIIGFPIALLLAWAFEMTPEGVKRTEDLATDETVASSKMDGLILVGMVAVLGLGIWQQFSDKTIVQNKTPIIPVQTESPKKEAPIQANSIAVLPFTDLSPNKDQEYFSDGMAEEILNVLVRVNALKVTSRTSAFQFKGQEMGIPAIAKQLKVRHILEGSVRKAGDNLRITAQLIDTKDDNHLWSKTFDRPLSTDNIFAIQDEISNAIVRALKDKLGLGSIENLSIKQGTQNLTAYELYLKAKPLILSRIQLDIADDYLAKALELDENYAEAWEMRGIVEVLKFGYGYSENETKSDQLAQHYANKALALDKDSADALITKAFIHSKNARRLRQQHSFTKIIEDYSAAIKINPNNPTSYNWRGLAYMSVGKRQEAINDFYKCSDIEAMYLPCVSNSIEVLAELGKDKEALQLLAKALSRKLVKMYYINLGLLARNKKKLLFMAVTNETNMLDNFQGQEQLYQAFLNPTQDHSKLIQSIHEYLNNKEKKTQYMARAQLLFPIGGYDGIPYIGFIWGKENQAYRQSPQFKSYIKKAGIYTYWQESGYPPQCRPLGDDDFECD